MPEVIEKKQVVYFYLAGALDNAAVAEIAKLAMYSLFTAAIDYYEQHGKKPRVYTIWDEAQIMIAKNIEHVLTQSRSHGMACILAHQAMSQLNPPGGVDLRELVMQCTHYQAGLRSPRSLADGLHLPHLGNDEVLPPRLRRLPRPTCWPAASTRRARASTATATARSRSGIHRPPAFLPGHSQCQPPSQRVAHVDRSPVPAVSVSRLVSHVHRLAGPQTFARGLRASTLAARRPTQRS